ncbi:hypothetical protein [Phyllobacterium sophorae]|uniref:Uncharacterized protein n=1 Tax=Phyllobacterium sophorae TaxID=1520277 RepID=A0A2P7BAL1_9HYPH|nr:hypothetical protein [Phyllobacterium sophorae]PSH63462.1 hypothetical protein CU103_14420 [Phyllobacterium sophorae]
MIAMKAVEAAVWRFLGRPGVRFPPENIASRPILAQTPANLAEEMPNLPNENQPGREVYMYRVDEFHQGNELAPHARDDYGAPPHDRLWFWGGSFVLWSFPC